MDNFTASLIGTGVGASLAGTTAYLLARYNNRKTKHRNLADRLDSILKIGLQYPYVEQEIFTENWDREKLKSNNKEEAERYQRYDIYTNIIFNYMAELAEYHDFNIHSIQNEVDITSWARTHRKIWNEPANPKENHIGYSVECANLMKRFIEG